MKIKIWNHKVSWIALRAKWKEENIWTWRQYILVYKTEVKTGERVLRIYETASISLSTVMQL